MIHEYDRVIIKASGIHGIVIDIRHTNRTYYLVESDDDNRLIDCTEGELEKVN